LNHKKTTFFFTRNRVLHRQERHRSLSSNFVSVYTRRAGYCTVNGTIRRYEASQLCEGLWIPWAGSALSWTSCTQRRNQIIYGSPKITDRSFHTEWLFSNTGEKLIIEANEMHYTPRPR
jgi:hypothetical protein